MFHLFKKKSHLYALSLAVFGNKLTSHWTMFEFHEVFKLNASQSNENYRNFLMKDYPKVMFVSKAPGKKGKPRILLDSKVSQSEALVASCVKRNVIWP